MMIQNSTSSGGSSRAGRGQWRRFWPVLATLAMLAVVLVVRADGPVVQSVGEADPHRSVFLDDPAFGKDPFFPLSERRKVKVPVIETNRPVVVVDELVLKGLSGTPGNRLAIINNYTLAEGEESSIKINGSPVTITCIEVKEESVIVNVNGQTRELHLRSKLTGK